MIFLIAGLAALISWLFKTDSTITFVVTLFTIILAGFIFQFLLFFRIIC